MAVTGLNGARSQQNHKYYQKNRKKFIHLISLLPNRP
jgi:hypothetical protein